MYLVNVCGRWQKICSLLLLLLLHPERFSGGKRKKIFPPHPQHPADGLPDHLVSGVPGHGTVPESGGKYKIVIGWNGTIGFLGAPENK
jgi:hypothetical protein